MRIDKFLKVSRILKRRTVAAEACDQGRVLVGGKKVKPAHTLKIGDEVWVVFGDKTVKFTIKSLNEKANKEQAEMLYEVIE